MPVDTLAASIETGVGGSRGAGGGQRPPGIPASERVYITGMLIALGAILMFFAAFASAWAVRRGLPGAGWHPIPLPRILWLNTLILAASGLTVAYSRRCWFAGRRADHRYWWSVTTILALAFLAGQLLAWRQMFAVGLFLRATPSASFYYVFTAAHALHVVGGIAALVAVSLRPPRRLTRETATYLVALYWRFLGALWIVIFLMLWLGD